MPLDRSRSPEKEHGPHTLRVWSGVIVGTNGDDVFVELGPRMQGVISAREFPGDVAIGEEHEFTLRGQEEDLWVLALREARSLTTWEDMEEGSLVQARVVRKKHGGLELKVGPLHAFMPKSHTGLARGQDPEVLAGKTVTCEVLEVDRERQRVLVSRKCVLQRERESRRQQEIGHLKPGSIVQGRITRIEDFGAFVRFGSGLEGLIHVSNLSHERVAHPSELLRLDDQVEAKILTIRRAGKRISLGLKQMQESPWNDLERTGYVDQIVEGRVCRVVDFGAFVELRKGVEGLLHASECGFGPGQRPRERFKVGQRLSLRIVAMECERERLSLSLLHRNGACIDAEEAASSRLFDELRSAEHERGRLATNLGPLLDRALGSPGPAASGGESAAC